MRQWRAGPARGVRVAAGSSPDAGLRDGADDGVGECGLVRSICAAWGCGDFGSGPWADWKIEPWENLRASRPGEVRHRALARSGRSAALIVCRESCQPRNPVVAELEQPGDGNLEFDTASPAAEVDRP